MKLIQKLGKRPYGNCKYPVYFGLFQCEFCGTKKEDTLSNGRKNISCGCRRGKRGAGKSNKCGKLLCCQLFYDAIRSRVQPESLEEHTQCAYFAVKVWNDITDSMHPLIVGVDRLFKRAA